MRIECFSEYTGGIGECENVLPSSGGNQTFRGPREAVVLEFTMNLAFVGRGAQAVRRTRREQHPGGTSPEHKHVLCTLSDRSLLG